MWRSLVIGNSRLHWAELAADQLLKVWHTQHLTATEAEPLLDSTDLWIASVVPSQTPLWNAHPASHLIRLDQIPLAGMYPSFGIDRALALWGAIATMGAPVLVIDAGTALTFTAADATQTLVGGAISPGLGLQFQMLDRATAALPLVSLPAQLPDRWALNTSEAIASGIVHTAVAGVRAFLNDWWQRFPEQPVVVTGGDGDRLYAYLQQAGEETEPIKLDPLLMVWGIREVRRAAQRGQRTDSEAAPC